MSKKFDINFFKSATAANTDTKAPITEGPAGPAHKYTEKPEVPAGSVKVDGVKAPVTEGPAGEKLQHNNKVASMDKAYQVAGDKGDTKVAGQPESPKIPMGMADAKVTVPQEDGEKGKLTNPSGETADPSAELPKPKEEKALAGKFMEAGGDGGMIDKPKDFTADVSAHKEKESSAITPGEKGLGKKSYVIEWVKYSAVESQEMIKAAASDIIGNLVVISKRANVPLTSPILASMIKTAEEIMNMAETGNVSGIPGVLTDAPAVPAAPESPAPVVNPVDAAKVTPAAAAVVEPMAEARPVAPAAADAPTVEADLNKDQDLKNIFE